MIKEAITRVSEILFWTVGVIYWFNGNLEIGLLAMLVGEVIGIKRVLESNNA